MIYLFAIALVVSMIFSFINVITFIKNRIAGKVVSYDYTRLGFSFMIVTCTFLFLMAIIYYMINPTPVKPSNNPVPAMNNASQMLNQDIENYDATKVQEWEVTPIPKQQTKLFPTPATTNRVPADIQQKMNSITKTKPTSVPTLKPVQTTNPDDMITVKRLNQITMRINGYTSYIAEQRIEKIKRSDLRKSDIIIN